MNQIIILDEKGNAKIYDNSKVLCGIDVYFIQGDNNTVVIEEPYQIHELKILIAGNGNKVEIGSNSEIRKMAVLMNTKSDSRILKLGKHIFCGEVKFHLWNEKSRIIVGDDCLLSSDIVIEADDGYSIYDIVTNELINDESETILGQHIWLGYGVFVMGGSKLSSNTIVAARSVVNDKYTDEFTIIGGNPCKIIKKNVNFSKYLIKYFK